ncbi:sexual development transcription factor nsdd [Gigaspora margarita]|uniref:Sexual development transcription factor nsdd n=1 Tax=Gigaspora margarita TaxID=4874 RepID=A0A8H3XDR6_GIGMA|nr:sexual development transcription factor nsdd [Gigaspora margarita]
MDVSSICSFPSFGNEAIHSSASLTRTDVLTRTSSSDSDNNKSVLPPISSILCPLTQSVPVKTSLSHHDDSSMTIPPPYLQSSTSKHHPMNSESRLEHHASSVSSSVVNHAVDHPHENNIHLQVTCMHPSSLPPNNGLVHPSIQHSQPCNPSAWENQHTSLITNGYRSPPIPLRPQSQISSSNPTNVVSLPVNDELKQSPAQKPSIQYGTSSFPSEYHHYRASFEKDVYQSVSLNSEKTSVDLKKIIDHCSLIGQFAAQYSDMRNQSGNRSLNWPSTIPNEPASIPTEAHVTEMINKAFEVLYVLNALKDETVNRRGPSEIELIRNKRTTSGVAPTRPKYRKRTKRPAPPGRCHSCNIQETPEWRRGPDGARTLCNACGLHFAKLTRKRAQTALQEQQQRALRALQTHPYAPQHMLAYSSKITPFPGFPTHMMTHGQLLTSTTHITEK